MLQQVRSMYISLTLTVRQAAPLTFVFVFDIGAHSLSVLADTKDANTS